MLKILTIALATLTAAGALACERGDYECRLNEIVRENRERDAAWEQKMHNMRMEDEAFLACQKLNEMEIDMRYRGY